MVKGRRVKAHGSRHSLCIMLCLLHINIVTLHPGAAFLKIATGFWIRFVFLKFVLLQLMVIIRANLSLCCMKIAKISKSIKN